MRRRLVMLLFALVVMALGVVAQPPTPLVTLRPERLDVQPGDEVQFLSEFTNPLADTTIPVAVSWDYAMPDGTEGQVVQSSTLTVPNVVAAIPAIIISEGAAYVMGSATINGVVIAPTIQVHPETGATTVTALPMGVAAGEKVLFHWRVKVAGGSVVTPTGETIPDPPDPPIL